MNYYNLHIGDYRSATMHLSNEEDLAYRRLLDMYYDTEQPIPADTQWVSRRLRLDKGVVESVLKDFFFLTEEGYRNSRCDAEIAEYTKKAEISRENGKKGGRRKAAPALILNPAGSSQVPNPNPNVTQALANQEPITNNQILKPSRPATPSEPEEKFLKNENPPSQAKREKTDAEKAKPEGELQPRAETALQAACRKTWHAYSQAYAERYDVAPTRNAQVNSQIKSFCQKIPLDEAPAVAAFFVRHNDAFYTRKAHDVGLMLADAPKLRTEWKTGKLVNEHIAKTSTADPGARANKPADVWWASESGVIAKGKQLGIAPRPGETMNEFKGRINVKMYELKNEQEQQKSAVS